MNEKISEKSTAVEKKGSVSFADMMKLAKEDDLRIFVQTYADKDETFRQAFMDYLTQKYIGTKKRKQKDYIKEITNIFANTTGNIRPKYSYRYDYDDDSDWMTIADDIKVLLADAEILLKAGDTADVITIVMHFLKTASENVDDSIYYDDDGQYEMRECCEKAGELIMEIMKNPSVDLKQKQEIFHDICEIEEEGSLHNYTEYDVEELKFEMGTLLLSPEERLAMIDGKIKELEEKKYRAYRYVEMKIDYLNELKRYEEAQDVMDSYIHLPEIRRIKVESLQSLGKYDEALKILDEGIAISKEQRYSGNEIQWLVMKLKIYELQKSVKDIINTSRRLFITTNGDKEYYENLKNYVDDSEWKAFLHDMIAEIKYRSESIAYIYENEKEYDELMGFISSHSDSIRYILSYGLRMPEKYHQSLLDIFTSAIKAYAADRNNMNRESYYDIAKKLQEAKKLSGGEEVVNRIVAEFRVVYKRRPAMMEELREL